eukprot:g4583.t1
MSVSAVSASLSHHPSESVKYGNTAFDDTDECGDGKDCDKREGDIAYDSDETGRTDLEQLDVGLSSLTLRDSTLSQDHDDEFDHSGLFDSDSGDSSSSSSSSVSSSSSGPSTPCAQSADLPVTSPNFRRDRNRALLLKLLKLEQPVLTLQMLDFLCQDNVCKMLMSFIVRIPEIIEEDKEKKEVDDAVIVEENKKLKVIGTREKSGSFVVQDKGADADDELDDDVPISVHGGSDLETHLHGGPASSPHPPVPPLNVQKSRNENSGIAMTTVAAAVAAHAASTGTLRINSSTEILASATTAAMSPMAKELEIVSSPAMTDEDFSGQEMEDVRDNGATDELDDGSNDDGDERESIARRNGSLRVVKEMRVFSEEIDGEAMQLSHRAMKLLDAHSCEDYDIGGYGHGHGMGSIPRQIARPDSVVGIFLERKMVQVTESLFSAFNEKSKANFHHVCNAMRSLLVLHADKLIQIIGGSQSAVETHLGALLPYLHHPPVSDLLVDLVCLPTTTTEVDVSNASEEEGRFGSSGVVVGSHGMEDQLLAHQCSNRVKWQYYCSLARWRFLVVLASRIYSADPLLPVSHSEAAADTLLRVVDHYCADSNAEIVLQPLGHCPEIVDGLVAGACCLDVEYENLERSRGNGRGGSISDNEFSSLNMTVADESTCGLTDKELFDRKRRRECVSLQVLQALLLRAEQDQVSAPLTGRICVGSEIAPSVTNQMSSVAELFRTEVLRHISKLVSRLMLQIVSPSSKTSESVSVAVNENKVNSIAALDTPISDETMKSPRFSEADDLSSSVIVVDPAIQCKTPKATPAEESVTNNCGSDSVAQGKRPRRKREDRGFSYTRLMLIEVLGCLARSHPHTVLDALPAAVWENFVSWLFRHDQNNLYHNAFVSLFIAAVHADHLPTLKFLLGERKNVNSTQNLTPTDDAVEGEEKNALADKTFGVGMDLTDRNGNASGYNENVNFLDRAIEHYNTPGTSAVRGHLLICFNILRLKSSCATSKNGSDGRRDPTSIGTSVAVNDGVDDDNESLDSNSNTNMTSTSIASNGESAKSAGAIWLNSRLNNDKVWEGFQAKLRADTIAQRVQHFELPLVDCGYLWINGSEADGKNADAAAAAKLDAEASAAKRQDIDIGSAFAFELGFDTRRDDDDIDVVSDNARDLINVLGWRDSNPTESFDESDDDDIRQVETFER